MKFKATQTISLLLLCILPNLSLAQPAERSFSPNDLSILFPLQPKTGRPLFPVQPGGAGNSIVTTDQFSTVIDAASKEGVYVDDKIKDPNNWYLVSMRYIPCNFFAGSTPQCKEQIRFVFQQFESQGFSDYGMHVVYTFDESSAPQVSPRLQSFRKLKNDFSANFDKQLSINPVLKSPLGAKYMAELKSEVFAQHIFNRAPSTITFFGLGKDPSGGDFSDVFHWIFLTGDLNPSGVWQQNVLPVGAPATSESLLFGTESHPDGSIEFEDALKISAGQIGVFNLGAKTKETALLILDQAKTNDHNVSCASCHAADQAALDPFTTDFQSTLKSFPRITDFILDRTLHPLPEGGFSAPVRIFSYQLASPVIAQRVANDTAYAVHQADGLLQLTEIRQCANVESRKRVLQCLHASPDARVDDCMKKYCTGH